MGGLEVNREGDHPAHLQRRFPNRYSMPSHTSPRFGVSIALDLHPSAESTSLVSVLMRHWIQSDREEGEGRKHLQPKTLGGDFSRGSTG